MNGQSFVGLRLATGQLKESFHPIRKKQGFQGFVTITPHPFPVKSLRRKKRTWHLKRRNYHFAFGGQEAFGVMIDSSL